MKSSRETLSSSKLHPKHDREGERTATGQRKRYGEEPHNETNKGIDLNALWNY
jgi:hypothetical protein